MSRMLLVVFAVLSSVCFLAWGSLNQPTTLSPGISESVTKDKSAAFRHAPIMPKGVVKLDGYTLDKARAFPGQSWLVMIDQNFSTTDSKFPARTIRFETFCHNVNGVKDLMIGKIPVQDTYERVRIFESKTWIPDIHIPNENEPLMESLGVERGDFPTFFLFKGESQTRFNPKGSGRLFHDRKDWDDLVLWLHSQGTPVPSLHTIADMDKLVIKFEKQGFSNEVLEEAKKVAEGEHKHDRKAAMYVKIMAKIQANGIEYIAQELSRIKKMEAGANLLPEKRHEIQDKIYILQVFERSTSEEFPPQVDPDADLDKYVAENFSGVKLTEISTKIAKDKDGKIIERPAKMHPAASGAHFDI